MAFNNYLEDENDKPYFTKNSLAYYYDKMEGFAKAVEGSAKALNLTKEEVEKRITLYIEQNKNELDQRLEDWDGKLETFDSSVETLLAEWVADGTLTHVIDGTLIDQKIQPVVNHVTSKINEINSSFVNNETVRPLITFIDDDGLSKVSTVLKDIFTTRNVPCTIAAVSGFIKSGIGTSKEELLTLQNDFGWEFASHTKNHKQLNDLTNSDLLIELGDSQKELTEMGFNITSLVYPYGSPNENTRKIASKFYKYAVNSAGGGLNNLPIKQFSINRIAIGSYTTTGRDHLDYYKSLVDTAISTNSWLIFMTHINETGEQGVQDIKDVLDYIISKNIEVVNLNKGYEVFGNVLYNGDYNGDLFNDKFNVITKSGAAFTNQMRKSMVNAITPISSFPTGDSFHSFLNIDASQFPGLNGAGNLYTHKDLNTDAGFSYQVFIPYNTSEIHFRKALTPSTWKPFTRIDNGGGSTTQESGLLIGLQNQYLSTTLPTEFTVNKITVNIVTNAMAAGFPNNQGGVLTTTRMTADSGYCSQKFRIYGTTNEYTREFSGTSWTGWKLVKVGLPKIVHTYEGGTVIAQSSLRITIPYVGVEINDVVSVTSQTQLPSGVFVHGRMSNTNQVEITFVNCKSTDVLLGAIVLCVSVHRN